MLIELKAMQGHLNSTCSAISENSVSADGADAVQVIIELNPRAARRTRHLAMASPRINGHF